MRSRDIERVLELRNQLKIVVGEINNVGAHRGKPISLGVYEVGLTPQWVKLPQEDQDFVIDTMLRLLGYKKLQIEQDLQDLYNLNEGD